MIHQPFVIWQSHPQISSSLRLLILWLVRPNSFVIYYCLFLFSKNSFLSMAPLTNAITAFSMLWCMPATSTGTEHTVLTLSQTTNFRLFQTQGVCRRQFQTWWRWQKVLQMGRKHCGKRRNCSLRAISPFPTVFSEDLNFRHVKTRACLGKG